MAVSNHCKKQTAKNKGNSNANNSNPSDRQIMGDIFSSRFTHGKHSGYL